MNELSLVVHGKVFILGEYLALSGGPAILGTTQKGFHFKLSNRFRASSGPNVSSAFHPDSPAGCLVRKWSNEGLKPVFEKILFSDDFEGAGGFGGSTAECIAAYDCFHFNSNQASDGGPQEVQSTGTLWKEYRQIHQNRKVPPSGYDLLVQMAALQSASVFKVEKGVENDFPKLEEISIPIIHLFQTSHLADRKTKTHEHLSGKNLADIVLSMEFVSEGERILRTALSTSDVLEFGKCLSEYAQFLNSHGFETSDVTADRLDFMKVSGVYGAKGCGAMGTDSLIVLTDRSSKTKEAINQLALEKGFIPLKFKYVED